MTLLEPHLPTALRDPVASVATTSLRLVDALRQRSSLMRENAVIPIIIVILIVVLLALASTLVVAAVILCANHGGVLDGVVNIGKGYVRVTRHKI